MRKSQRRSVVLAPSQSMTQISRKKRPKRLPLRRPLSLKRRRSNQHPFNSRNNFQRRSKRRRSSRNWRHYSADLLPLPKRSRKAKAKRKRRRRIRRRKHRNLLKHKLKKLKRKSL